MLVNSSCRSGAAIRPHSRFDHLFSGCVDFGPSTQSVRVTPGGQIGRLCGRYAPWRDEQDRTLRGLEQPQADTAEHAAGEWSVPAIADDDEVDIGLLGEVVDRSMCGTVASLPDDQFGVDALVPKFRDNALESEWDVVVLFDKKPGPGDSRLLNV